MSCMHTFSVDIITANHLIIKSREHMLQEKINFSKIYHQEITEPAMNKIFKISVIVNYDLISIRILVNMYKLKLHRIHLYIHIST